MPNERIKSKLKFDRQKKSFLSILIALGVKNQEQMMMTLQTLPCTLQTFQHFKVVYFFSSTPLTQFMPAESLEEDNFV